MRRAACSLLFLIAFVSYAAYAQEAQPASPPSNTQTAAQDAAAQSTPGGQLAEASKEAAGEENAEFKHSPSVRWLAGLTGLSPQAAYWVFVSLNFVIIAGAVVWFWKSNLPAMFRRRTDDIRKGMEEARRASEDAGRRLADVESRLSRLGNEIAAMRAAAEQEAAAEEQRIRAAAEEDKKKIIAAAESEIEAAGRQARRDLKAFAAELAVSLAERRIQVDTSTDRELVRTFVNELGDNGRGGH